MNAILINSLADGGAEKVAFVVPKQVRNARKIISPFIGVPNL